MHVPRQAILGSIAARKTVLINAEALRRKLEEGEVKQWWLARRLGVDRKTVTRWLSGQTPRISEDNLQALASELGCARHELVVQDSLEDLGTREDRWVAARRLQHSDLTEMVGPSYSWELAETLIRSTIDPEMPPDLQAALYLQLGTCGMYQHKQELVLSSGEIALRKAKEADDPQLQHQARQMIGNQALMIGELARSVEQYTEILKSPQFFPSQAKLAATTSNLAMARWQRAEYALSLKGWEQAMALWSEVDTVISMTTAWYLRSELHAELCMLDEAEHCVARCAELCEQIGYSKSRIMCIGVQADIASIREEHALAVELADQAAAAYRTAPNVNPAAHLSVVRALRRAGELQRSREYLAWMLTFVIDNRHSIARVQIELARHLKLEGKEQEALEKVNEANRIFLDVGAPLRVREGLPGEYYKQGPDAEPLPLQS